MFDYLLILNIISFFVYGIDKIFAIVNFNRVREITLLFLTIIGGSFGSLLAMILFRHKIRKKRFIIVNVFSVILWIILLYLCNVVS